MAKYNALQRENSKFLVQKPYFSQLQYTQSSRNINEQEQEIHENDSPQDDQIRRKSDEIHHRQMDQSLPRLSMDQEHYLASRNELIPKSIRSKVIKQISSAFNNRFVILSSEETTSSIIHIDGEGSTIRSY